MDEAWNAVKEALITEETDTLAANEIKGIFKHWKPMLSAAKFWTANRVSTVATPALFVR